MPAPVSTASPVQPAPASPLHTAVSPTVFPVCTPVSPVQPAAVSAASPIQPAPVSPVYTAVSPTASPFCTPESPVPSTSVQPLDDTPLPSNSDKSDNDALDNLSNSFSDSDSDHLPFSDDPNPW